ncbi:MAG: ribonuclease P protein subunit [Candidatus Hadarchaeales archaeon]
MKEKAPCASGLIGLHVEVLESRDPGLIGARGRVVDETMKMLFIEHEGKIKKVPKSISILLVTLPDGERVKISGEKLIGRLENRIGKTG